MPASAQQLAAASEAALVALDVRTFTPPADPMPPIASSQQLPRPAWPVVDSVGEWADWADSALPMGELALALDLVRDLEELALAQDLAQDSAPVF